MPTRTRTDSKEEAEARYQTELTNHIKDLVSTESGKYWKVTDYARKLRYEKHLEEARVNKMIRSGFIEAYKINEDNVKHNKAYATFSAAMSRIMYMVRVPDKLYAEVRMEGLTFTSAWIKLTSGGNPKDQLKRMDKGQELNKKKGYLDDTLAGSKAKKEKFESENGVEEISTEKLTKLDNDLANLNDTSTSGIRELMKSGKRGKKGWTSPELGKDSDEEWVKQGKLIVRDDPKRFVQLIEKCVEVGLFSQAYLKLTKSELKDKLDY
jgi:hypothetical protein